MKYFEKNFKYKYIFCLGCFQKLSSMMKYLVYIKQTLI